MGNWNFPKFVLGGAMVVLILGTGACSAQVAPTSQPSADSIDQAMDQAEVRALAEEAARLAIEGAEINPGEVSREELRGLIADVLVETSSTSNQICLSLPR